MVDPKEPSEVKRVAIKYMRKGAGMGIFSTKEHLLRRRALNGSRHVAPTLFIWFLSGQSKRDVM